jgi:hypothetical protein
MPTSDRAAEPRQDRRKRRAQADYEKLIAVANFYVLPVTSKTHRRRPQSDHAGKDGESDLRKCRATAK